MISYIDRGDILNLNIKHNAIVNPVNCVGAMGKGLALQFKEKYPLNYKAYRSYCFNNQMKLGKSFIFFENEKKIINFPTKGHWSKPSKLSYIEAGLKDLVTRLDEEDVIVFPLLGCGEGGLHPHRVLPLMHKYLDHCGCKVYICMDISKVFKPLYQIIRELENDNANRVS